MVRSLLDGTKMQTRRAVKLWNHPFVPDSKPVPSDLEYLPDFTCYRATCQYGQPGDRLWVRESFDPIYPQDPHYNGGRPIEYDYQATYQHGYRLGDSLGIKKVWKPSIHMPRAASRITLEITGVRVERLQDISEEDARAEGVDFDPGEGGFFFVPGQGGCSADTAVGSYRLLWESINGSGSWDANPWVWVIQFKRVLA